MEDLTEEQRYYLEIPGHGPNRSLHNLSSVDIDQILRYECRPNDDPTVAKNEMHLRYHVRYDLRVCLCVSVLSRLVGVPLFSLLSLFSLSPLSLLSLFFLSSLSSLLSLFCHAPEVRREVRLGFVALTTYLLLILALVFRLVD
jgi:hypothetical protein